MTRRDILIHWRKKAGLTQAAAAAILGYETQQTISDKERGVFGTSGRDIKFIRFHAQATGIDLPEVDA